MRLCQGDEREREGGREREREREGERERERENFRPDAFDCTVRGIRVANSVEVKFHR